MTKERKILCIIKSDSIENVCLHFCRIIRDIERKHGIITTDCIKIQSEDNNSVLTVYSPTHKDDQ